MRLPHVLVSVRSFRRPRNIPDETEFRDHWAERTAVRSSAWCY
jgi:hypothetical protein